jgi:hypothetical protein
MPRSCTICKHPERTAVDAALLAGEPYRSISKRFGTSEPATFRHRDEHIARAVRAAKELAQVSAGRSAAEISEDLVRRALELLDTAEKNGDIRERATASREARECLRLRAELLGETPKAPAAVFNFLVEVPPKLNAQDWIATYARTSR